MGKNIKKASGGSEDDELEYQKQLEKINKEWLFGLIFPEMLRRNSVWNDNVIECIVDETQAVAEIAYNRLHRND